MVVLVKTTQGTVKKAFIRNTTFSEVNEDNKKMNGLPMAQIASVMWPVQGKIIDLPVKKWLEIAEENNFWSLSA